METLQFNAEVFDKTTREYLKKSLTIRATPSTDKKEKTSKSYLILCAHEQNLLTDSFEVVEDKSSPDWHEYFELFVVQSPLFIVVGVQSK